CLTDIATEYAYPVCVTQGCTDRQTLPRVAPEVGDPVAGSQAVVRGGRPADGTGGPLAARAHEAPLVHGRAARAAVAAADHARSPVRGAAHPPPPLHDPPH